MSKKQTELGHFADRQAGPAATPPCIQQKMALHGSLPLEGQGIFTHARDELTIAYGLIQPEDMVPTIVSLQERLETVRQGEIDRVRRRLGRLSPEQENAIESLTRGMINKILHPAMAVLKTASAENDSSFFVEIVHRIFNLGEKRKHEDPAQTVEKNIDPAALMQPPNRPVLLNQ
jgi:hypothetical protein